MTKLNSKIVEITERIINRSKDTRQNYLENIIAMEENSDTDRSSISCSNMAHAAATSAEDQDSVLMNSKPNIGIVSSYNDMLSAHKTYENYPEILRKYSLKYNAVAQVAGAVPAMCDGVTQGQPGMEMSLFSRDVISLSAAIGLSHNVFDSSVYLGVCDKIVPGLVIAAATFGHLPSIFLPAGPMPSGISNDEKTEVRKRFADGLCDRNEKLKFLRIMEKVLVLFMVRLIVIKCSWR